ncbi:hypothetical protein HKX48_000810, partial [Thoreauomyces humboldtii]
MRFTILTILTALTSLVAADLSSPNNTIWQNVQAYNQNVDSGINTYHLSVVNGYSYAGLKETLSGPGPFTFFAPSDHSFARLKQSNPAFLNAWVNDQACIMGTLKYHIIPSVYDIHNNPPKVSTLQSIVKPAWIQATIYPTTPVNPPGWVVAILRGSGPIYASIVHTMKSSNGILYVI